MWGYGNVFFYNDDVLVERISMYGSLGAQGWKKYEYSFPEGLHSFTWKLSPSLWGNQLYAGLDAIYFK